MSENVAETIRGTDEVTKQDVHSSPQSGWMSHWMSSTGCKPAAKQACGRLSICYESQEEENCDPGPLRLVNNEAGPEKVGDASEECGKQSSEVAETKSARSSFPMFNLLKKVDGGALVRKVDRPSSSQWESIKTQADQEDKGFQLFSLGGSEKQLKDLPPMIQWVHEAKLPTKENLLKNGCISEYEDEGKLNVEKSIKGDFVVSSSKVIPYGFNFGNTLSRSMCKELNRSNSVLEFEQQRVTNTVYHSNSMLLVQDKAGSTSFESSRNPLVTFNDAQILPRDPSTSRSRPPEFVSKEIQTLQEQSGIELFPRKTVDSIEESSRVSKKFSTTHHFLFAKTDFNLTEGGHMLKDSMVSTKWKEKCSPGLFQFNQDNFFPIKSGVKLQLLGSPVGSEGEKDAQEIKTSSVNIRNESSSETNTMDFNTLRKNHVTGVVSSSSNKHIEGEKHTINPQGVLDSAREAGGSTHKRKLPDINQQPNDLVANASSAGTSTSRTQSLDAEFLLLSAEQPMVKSNSRPAVCLESEQSRWVKRLKLSPTSACGTRSLKMGEDSSHDKVNIFSKIMKYTMSGSGPVTVRSYGKEPERLISQREILLSPKYPSIRSVKKNSEVTLSHPWVQRLRHKKAASSSSEKSKAAEVSESMHSKASTEVSEKQFPSLAAMALMGKVLRGYRTCPLKKMGSSVVWSS